MGKSKFTRREFLGTIAAVSALTGLEIKAQPNNNKINRFVLVSRHNPVLKNFEIMSPLSVGNGEFAFTCDATGLQTFPELYREKFPLCTMSQWGWHTIPRPANLVGKDLKLSEYDTYGRKVGYQSSSTDQKELFDWLRQNPHRLHLGQIGLRLLKSDGKEAKPQDITNIEQKLDLWTGVISSKFEFEGKSVSVKTCAHPTKDLLAVSIDSELISNGNLAVKFEFPYGSPDMHAADWNSNDKHFSSHSGYSANLMRIFRKLDNDEYSIGIGWDGNAKFDLEKDHKFILRGSENSLNFAVQFINQAKVNITTITSPKLTLTTSEKYWKNFWQTGGAVELIESNDSRAKELERRIVLSQYLTAINCSGSLPPQETGLTTNSWYGKFHLEMHWWHAAHFALWNRLPLLEKSLNWYNKVLPSACERAKQQGYNGARWAKMTEPEGRDAPSPIGPLLIWQQPHPIFYAELVYLTKPTKTTLKKFQQIVEQSAIFMADFAVFDSKTNRYILGPPVIPAQENHPAKETWNPTYELEYWRYGLKKANQWRERLGLKREAKWDEIVSKLSKLPEKDGVYLAHENCPQTFTERNIDHPSMLAAYGILNGELVDKETMRRTLKKVMKEWNWADTWGWDYPMTAMTAAKLGEGEIAIDALLLDTPKNGYAVNGHNYQRANLPLYLPGNGGLLYAIAMMAGGWKNAPTKANPGFPGKNWKVKVENLNINVLKEI
ncbi:MAG TPA: hypothetical protein PKY82_11485 [Pyrinomonadaceae bacterium]|nr:hypothetical protein [Pyrinomonadaceae bacterium]